MWSSTPMVGRGDAKQRTKKVSKTPSALCHCGVQSAHQFPARRELSSSLVSAPASNESTSSYPGASWRWTGALGRAKASKMPARVQTLQGRIGARRAQTRTRLIDPIDASESTQRGIRHQSTQCREKTWLGGWGRRGEATFFWPHCFQIRLTKIPTTLLVRTLRGVRGGAKEGRNIAVGLESRQPLGRKS